MEVYLQSMDLIVEVRAKFTQSAASDLILG